MPHPLPHLLSPQKPQSSKILVTISVGHLLQKIKKVLMSIILKTSLTILSLTVYCVRIANSPRLQVTPLLLLTLKPTLMTHCP